ncbi:hypothetical protein DFH09DRAFT_1086713 [Mycena vulgaris]|nr:hypothetical protein DFH09DRAFT_1086713 [Mycena vulgaris]
MVRAVARGLERGIAVILDPTQPGWCARRLKPLHNMLEAGPKPFEKPRSTRSSERSVHMAGRRAGGIVSLGTRKNLITPGVSTSVAALDLQYVSPELLNVRNPDLAVPGTIHLLLLRNLAICMVHENPSHPGRNPH